MPSIQAAHLTDKELVTHAEFYLIRDKALSSAFQEELVKRLRKAVEEKEDAAV